MLKIGLTGGIGSGKTTVSNYFMRIGESGKKNAIIDTDVIAREIVEPGKLVYKEIVQSFGEKILNSDLSINRPILREIIFNQPHSKQLLESITHPAIHKEVMRRLSSLDVPYCIIVIPLLFETQSQYPLDRILVVDSEKQVQINRTMLRDNASSSEIEAILNSQVSREYRLAHADDVVSNNGSEEELHLQIEKLHHLYLSAHQ